MKKQALFLSLSLLFPFFSAVAEENGKWQPLKADPALAVSALSGNDDGTELQERGNSLSRLISSIGKSLKERNREVKALSPEETVSSAIRNHSRDYWTGTVYTTNRRIWEHDESFKDYVLKTRAMAVDMETATLFITGFANHIPTGALLLVSDQPMIPEGIKTEQSDTMVTQRYVYEHVEIGIDALRMIIEEKRTVKHLKFDW